jgi:hypothetical protein
MFLELMLPANKRVRRVIESPVRVEEQEGHYVA